MNIIFVCLILFTPTKTNNVTFEKYTLILWIFYQVYFIKSLFTCPHFALLIFYYGKINIRLNDSNK